MMHMDMMTSLAGIGAFFAYFAAALGAEAIFLALYMAVTRHDEAALIRAGNVAAAVSLAGAVVGFTLPLASAMANAASLLDMIVWALVALVVQLAVYLIAGVVLRGLSQRIEAGDLAAGISLGTASLAVGILNAAAMTY